MNQIKMSRGGCNIHGILKCQRCTVERHIKNNEECKTRIIIKATSEFAYEDVVKYLRTLPETVSVDDYMKRHNLSMLWLVNKVGMDTVIETLQKEGKVAVFYHDTVPICVIKSPTFTLLYITTATDYRCSPG